MLHYKQDFVVVVVVADFVIKLDIMQVFDMKSFHFYPLSCMKMLISAIDFHKYYFYFRSLTTGKIVIIKLSIKAVLYHNVI